MVNIVLKWAPLNVAIPMRSFYVMFSNLRKVPFIDVYVISIPGEPE